MRSLKRDMDGGLVGSALLIIVGVILAYYISVADPHLWSTITHWIDTAWYDISRWLSQRGMH